MPGGRAIQKQTTSDQSAGVQIKTKGSGKNEQRGTDQGTEGSAEDTGGAGAGDPFMDGGEGAGRSDPADGTETGGGGMTMYRPEMPERPEMLQKAKPNYDNDFSMYPESIRVSFSDGKTVLYDRRIEQPAPVIIENIRIIRKWKQGYVNKPMRRRNRT